MPPAFGSGVVIDPDGLILTNYHVVQNATKIFVRLAGGKSSYADIHAADPRSDLAVLKLLNANLPPLRAGFPLRRCCRQAGARPIRADDVEPVRGRFSRWTAERFGGHSQQHSSARGDAPQGGRTHSSARTFTTRYCRTDARLRLGSSGGAAPSSPGEMIGLLDIVIMAAIHGGGDPPAEFALPINDPGAPRHRRAQTRRGSRVRLSRRRLRGSTRQRRRRRGHQRRAQFPGRHRQPNLPRGT